jgi:ubiquinone/menaquinone biosynthesis C-methylase UbiE
MDAGCGTGNLLGLAEQGYLIGVDLSAGMLNRAREKGGSDLVNADIEYLPFRDSCLDGIISINVFFQLLRPESFLRDAYGTLKPKGRLVLSTPCIRGLRGSVVHGIYEILRRPSLLLKLRSLIRLLMINKMIFERTSTSIYSIETIVEMLKDEGFEIKRIREAYAGENLLITAKKVKP